MLLLPILSWSRASKPIVSVVAVSDHEIEWNVHKGGSSNFFSSSQFLELGIPDSICVRLIDDDEGIFHARHKVYIKCIEACQNARNRYLSVSSNGKSVDLSWDGDDFIPKEISRYAAQLKYELRRPDDNTRYDLNSGNMFVLDMVQKYVSQTPEDLSKGLLDWLAVRMRGRGKERPLNPPEHMLLFEILGSRAAEGLKKVLSYSHEETRPNLTFFASLSGLTRRHEDSIREFVAGMIFNLKKSIEPIFSLDFKIDSNVAISYSKEGSNKRAAEVRLINDRINEASLNLIDALSLSIEALLKSESLHKSIPNLQSDLEVNSKILSVLFDKCDFDKNTLSYEDSFFELTGPDGRYVTVNYSPEVVKKITVRTERPLESMLICDDPSFNIRVVDLPVDALYTAIGTILWELVWFYQCDLFGEDARLLNLKEWFVGLK